MAMFKMFSGPAGAMVHEGQSRGRVWFVDQCCFLHMPGLGLGFLSAWSSERETGHMTAGEFIEIHMRVRLRRHAQRRVRHERSELACVCLAERPTLVHRGAEARTSEYINPQFPNIRGASFFSSPYY